MSLVEDRPGRGFFFTSNPLVSHGLADSMIFMQFHLKSWKDDSFPLKNPSSCLTTSITTTVATALVSIMALPILCMGSGQIHPLSPVLRLNWVVSILFARYLFSPFRHALGLLALMLQIEWLRLPPGLKLRPSKVIHWLQWFLYGCLQLIFGSFQLDSAYMN